MTDREVVARQYYRALDEHDYEALSSRLTPSFVHDRPDRSLEGRDRFVRFMREERPQTDTTHVVDVIYPGDDRLAVEGRLLDASGSLITGFVDVFSFDGDAVDAIETYTNA